MFKYKWPFHTSTGCVLLEQDLTAIYTSLTSLLQIHFFLGTTTDPLARFRTRLSIIMDDPGAPQPAAMAQPAAMVAQAALDLVQPQQPMQLVQPGAVARPRELSFNEPADVGSIAPGDNLAGPTIYIVLQQLAGLHPPGRVAVFDPEFVTHALATRDIDAEVALSRIAASIEETNGMVWVPLHLAALGGGHHWVLVVVHFRPFQVTSHGYGTRRRIVRVYDSLPGFFLRGNPQDRLRMLLWRCFKYCNPSSTWCTELPVCARQQNNTDCGVSICLNAMYLTAHPDRIDLPTGPPTDHSAYWLCGRMVILALSRRFLKHNLTLLEHDRAVERELKKQFSFAQSAIEKEVAQLACWKVVDQRLSGPKVELPAPTPLPEDQTGRLPSLQHSCPDLDLIRIVIKEFAALREVRDILDDVIRVASGLSGRVIEESIANVPANVPAPVLEPDLPDPRFSAGRQAAAVKNSTGDQYPDTEAVQNTKKDLSQIANGLQEVMCRINGSGKTSGGPDDRAMSRNVPN